ncbi:MAG: mechanosensitive ion channel [Planctomycetaceae bacterium]|nr:mechanosensitive ion channel [Planctomycetaceae bacterium]
MMYLLRTGIGYGVLGLILAGGLLHGRPASAQAPTETAPATPPPATSSPVEQIAALQAQVANAELAEDQKLRAAELAQQALADLQAAEASRGDAANYASATEKIPQRLEDVNRELIQLDRAGEPRLERAASLAELETERNDAQQRIAEWEKQLAEPPTSRITRRRAARQTLIEHPARLQQISDRLAAAPPEGEPSLLIELRQLRLQAERQAVQERAVAAQNELAMLDAEDAVGLPIRLRDKLTRQLSRLRKQIELVSNEVNRLRKEEAAARVREARIAAMLAQPLLKPILDANQQIALEEAEVRKKHESIQKLDKELEQQLAGLNKDFQNIQSLDKDLGLSTSVGLRLRKLRSQLPKVRFHQTRQQARIEDLEVAQFTLYERGNQLDDLNNLDAKAAQLVEQFADLNEVEREQLAEDALTALRTQQEYLNKVVTAYRNYIDTLTQLDLHEEELVEETIRFATFIDERVLWVRSHPPLQLTGVFSDRESISWLGNLDTWQTLGRTLREDVSRVPLLYGAVTVLFVFLQLMRRRMGRHLHDATKSAQSRVSVSVLPTVRALEFTVLSAILWPGVMLFLSWRLWQTPDPPRTVLVVAATLSRLAAVFLLLELVRQSMRPRGLCEIHFGLHGATARHIRQRIRRFMMLALPLAAAVALTHFYNGDDRPAFIERMLFIVSMLVVSTFAHGLFHRGGELRELESFHDGGWIQHLSFLWHALAVGLPLVLVVLAATGYFYSAQELMVRGQISLCLLLSVIYLKAFLLRWLMLRHRRLRLQQLRERQQQAALQAQAAEDTGAPIPEAPVDEADLDTISRQSQRLVSTTLFVLSLIGAWMIWFDVIPAFRFLERWPLWEYAVQVREVIPNESGRPDYRMTEVLKAVTVAHLALGVLILVLTMTAARNLPGLLEITLLERLPIDRSTTYAVTALVRYSLVLIGIVLTSQALGIGWSKVQWLAAALTVGLGFGLQEIFANFVSGIIILFEQPVRVGDVVTIDGVSGVVNRIRIRATTITDWDRKEYIVPNREFITGRLLNWTLSDRMNRVLVNVTVAHGSDIDVVRSTILAVAQKHENVLDDPAPLAILEGMGEVGLNFVLRAYLPNLEIRLQTLHDLHAGVHRQLHAAGIEIALPRRELHMRTPVTIAESGRASGGNGRHHMTTRERVDASGG